MSQGINGRVALPGAVGSSSSLPFKDTVRWRQSEAMPSRADKASAAVLFRGKVMQILANTDGSAVFTQARVARDIWRSFNRAAVGSNERRSLRGSPGEYIGWYRRNAVRIGWLVLRMRMPDSG